MGNLSSFKCFALPKPLDPPPNENDTSQGLSSNLPSKISFEEDYLFQQFTEHVKFQSMAEMSQRFKKFEEEKSYLSKCPKELYTRFKELVEEKSNIWNIFKDRSERLEKEFYYFIDNKLIPSIQNNSLHSLRCQGCERIISSCQGDPELQHLLRKMCNFLEKRHYLSATTSQDYKVMKVIKNKRIVENCTAFSTEIQFVTQRKHNFETDQPIPNPEKNVKVIKSYTIHKNENQHISIVSLEKLFDELKILHKLQNKEYFSKIDRVFVENQNDENLIRINLVTNFAPYSFFNYLMAEQENCYFSEKETDNYNLMSLNLGINHKKFEDLREIFIKILKILKSIHSESIIHCDLNFGNIMINSNGNPVLIDFGNSKKIMKSQKESIVFGTLGFFPPEFANNPRIESSQIFTTKVDVFSFGCMLFKIFVTPDFGEVEIEKITKDNIKNRISQIFPNEFEMEKNQFKIKNKKKEEQFQIHFEKLLDSLARVLVNTLATDPQSRPEAEELLEKELFFQ